MRQELHASRAHTLLLISMPLVLLGMAVAALAAAGPRGPGLAPEDFSDEAFRALALAAVGLAALLLVVLAPGLWRRAPALVIDDEGLEDTGAFGAGRVRWDDVAGVRVVSLTRDYVGIDLVDVDAFLAGAPLLTKLALRSAMRMGYPPITIAGRALGVDTHELAQTITAAREAALARREGPDGVLREPGVPPARPFAGP